MKIETFNTLNLMLIGKIRFRFNKRFKHDGHTMNVLVSEINTMHETSRNITPETEKMLHKLMKQNKTELLTDGHDFFTTTGEKITQIKHPSFDSLKSIYSDEIKEFLYS
jgi:hypothetical protein